MLTYGRLQETISGVTCRAEEVMSDRVIEGRVLAYQVTKELGSIDFLMPPQQGQERGAFESNIVVIAMLICEPGLIIVFHVLESTIVPLRAFKMWNLPCVT